MNNSFKQILFYAFIITCFINTEHLNGDIDTDNASMNALFDHDTDQTEKEKKDTDSVDSDINEQSKMNEPEEISELEESNNEDQNRKIDNETYQAIKKLSDEIVPLLSSSKLTTQEELELRLEKTIQGLVTFKRKANITSKKVKKSAKKNMQNVQNIITLAVNEALKKSALNKATPAPATPPPSVDTKSSDLNVTNMMGSMSSPMSSPISSPMPAATPMPTLTPIAMPAATPMPIPTSTPTATPQASAMPGDDAAMQAEIDKMIAETMATLPPA